MVNTRKCYGGSAIGGTEKIKWEKPENEEEEEDENQEEEPQIEAKAWIFPLISS